LSDHVEHMREMAERGLFVCGCDECDREHESATEERGGIAPEPSSSGAQPSSMPRFPLAARVVAAFRSAAGVHRKGLVSEE
jgi:hypothetical protein